MASARRLNTHNHAKNEYLIVQTDDQEVGSLLNDIVAQINIKLTDGAVTSGNGKTEAKAKTDVVTDLSAEADEDAESGSDVDVGASMDAKMAANLEADMKEQMEADM